MSGVGGSSIPDARGELPKGGIFFNEGALPLPVLPEKHCIVKTEIFFCNDFLFEKVRICI